VIDGTQSGGALPLDGQKGRPDAVICAGYKWLMGPYSMALGYFSPRLQEGQPLEEGWIVRKDSEDFSGLIDYKEAYQPGAKRFDVGERSNFILVPMMIEALKLILEWNPENIQQYCEKLTTSFIQELKTFGYQVEDPAWRGHHMFGIRLPKQVDMDDLNNRLTNRNIHLSLRGSSLRISPNVYNEKKDIDALLDVLTDVGI
jgi:selenocysteine lyase/cysteine desulfurase